MANIIYGWNGQTKITLRQDISEPRSNNNAEVREAVRKQNLVGLTAEAEAEFVRVADIAESVGFVATIAASLVQADRTYESLQTTEPFTNTTTRRWNSTSTKSRPREYQSKWQQQQLGDVLERRTGLLQTS